MLIFLIGINEGIARSVARYLGDNPGVVLFGVAPSLALADLMLPATRTGVALIDWSVLVGSSRPSLQALRRGRPGLSIACVLDEVATYRSAALAAGADAVISKSGFANEIEPLLHGLLDPCDATDGGRHV